MNKDLLNKPMRQSIQGVVLFFLNAVRTFIKAFWPLILVYVINNEKLEPIKLYVFLGFGLIAVLLAIHAFLTYRNFYYQFAENEFVITKGYLKKVRIAIPYERIQSINTKQNLVQQVLKVQTMELDTAGSSQKEVQIIALSAESASMLVEQLNQYKTNLNSEHLSEIKPDEEVQEIIRESEKVILKLDVGDLIKIGISENHLKSAIILLALISGFISQIQDIFSGFMNNYEEDVENYMVEAGVIMVVYIIFFFLIIAILYSMIRVILMYFNLSFSKNGTLFRLKAGLLNKKQWTLPYTKIQVFLWNTNPVRKLLDFVTLQFVMAASNQNDKKQNILIPGVPAKKMELVMEELFSVTHMEPIVTLHPHRVYFVRFFMILGLLPVMIAAVFAYSEWIFWAIGSGWLLLIGVTSLLKHKRRSIRINERLIQSESGAVGEQFALMEQYKVQSVKFIQTFLQRRRKVASLILYTAGGFTIHIPYISTKDAWDLYDLILFQVESNHKDWM